MFYLKNHTKFTMIDEKFGRKQNFSQFSSNKFTKNGKEQ